MFLKTKIDPSSRDHSIPSEWILPFTRSCHSGEIDSRLYLGRGLWNTSSRSSACEQENGPARIFVNLLQLVRFFFGCPKSTKMKSWRLVESNGTELEWLLSPKDWSMANIGVQVCGFICILWTPFCHIKNTKFPSHGGFKSINRGILQARWMVDFMENPWMDEWVPPGLRKPPYGFVWKCWVNIPNYSHLIGIMIINQWV